jgi:hypothetical protein
MVSPQEIIILLRRRLIIIIIFVLFLDGGDGSILDNFRISQVTENYLFFFVLTILLLGHVMRA